MSRKTRALVVVDPNTTAQTELGELYAEGIIGAWNGYHYSEGGAVVSVDILDPRALDLIDAHPLLTRLPYHTDPDPNGVQQSHIDAQHPEVKDKLQALGKLDANFKLVGNMMGRELYQHLHDMYKDYTSYFHPDF